MTQPRNHETMDIKRAEGLIDGTLTDWRTTDLDLLLNYYRLTGAIVDAP